MKIERVGDNSVKVFVADSELSFMDVRTENFASAESEEISRFLFYIFGAIKERTGFDPFSCPIKIEAMSTNKGLHLTVSRIKGAKPAKVKVSASKKCRRPKTVQKSMAAYYFKDINHTVKALFGLPEKLLRKSQLRRYDEGGYVFIADKTRQLMAYHFYIAEYADRCAYSDRALCAEEHSYLIAEGDRLGDFVNKLKTIE